MEESVHYIIGHSLFFKITCCQEKDIFFLPASLQMSVKRVLSQGCYIDCLRLYGGRLEAGLLRGQDSGPGQLKGQDSGPGQLKGQDSGPGRGAGQDLWSTIHRVKLSPVELSRVGGAGVVRIPLHTRYCNPPLYFFMLMD